MNLSHRRSRRVAVGLLLFVCAGTSYDWAGQSCPGNLHKPIFELTSGVVVDGADSRAYLMRPHGGIEAISLDDGQPLWTTDAADKPLWVKDGLLLAQRDPGDRLGVLLLVVIEMSTNDHGERRMEAPLPPRVSAAIQQDLQSAFTTTIRPWDRGVLVTWESSRRKTASAVPPRRDEPLIEHWSGAFTVNLETATVVEIDPTEVHGVELERLPRCLGEKVESGVLSSPPHRAGPVIARVTEERTPSGSHRLVLDRWRTEDGDALARIVLLDGKPVAHLVSADVRHVSVCTVAEGAAWDRYLWTIHSLETGERVGSSRLFTSVTPFIVRRDLLIHLSQPHGRRIGEQWIDRPLELRAVAMSEGAERWTRPIRDTRFTGPAPPTR